MKKLFVWSVLLSSLTLTWGETSDPPPTTYTANTDMVIRTPPSPPSLGPAGYVFHDPTYGTRMMRVTDGNSLPGAQNVAFHTVGGGLTNIWNADTTKFTFRATGSRNMIYNFDPVHFKATPILSSNGQPLQVTTEVFSYQNPDVMYGMDASGANLVSYDVATGRYTVLANLSSLLPIKPPHPYHTLVTVDANDTNLAVAYGDIQDLEPYEVVLNMRTRQVALLYFDRATSSGWIQPFGSTKHIAITLPPGGTGLHESIIDLSGRYVDLSIEGLRPSADVFWDLQQNTIMQKTFKASGHWIFGFGNMINQAGSRQGQSNMAWWIRPLGAINDPTRVIDLSPEPPVPQAWVGEGHLSWANAQPNVLTPVFATTALAEGTPYTQPWQGEVVAIETDGKAQKVWRFANDQSILNKGSKVNYWDNPNGNISPNGRYFAFNSNWRDTLGTDPKGLYRIDVFLVDLTGSVPPH